MLGLPMTSMPLSAVSSNLSHVNMAAIMAESQGFASQQFHAHAQSQAATMAPTATIATSMVMPSLSSPHSSVATAAPLGAAATAALSAVAASTAPSPTSGTTMAAAAAAAAAAGGGVGGVGALLLQQQAQQRQQQQQQHSALAAAFSTFAAPTAIQPNAQPYLGPGVLPVGTDATMMGSPTIATVTPTAAAMAAAAAAAATPTAASAAAAAAATAAVGTATATATTAGMAVGTGTPVGISAPQAAPAADFTFDELLPPQSGLDGATFVPVTLPSSGLKRDAEVSAVGGSVVAVDAGVGVIGGDIAIGVGPAAVAAAAAAAAAAAKTANSRKRRKMVNPETGMLKEVVKEGRWTKEEDNLLRVAVEAVGPRNWKLIATEYMSGGRTDVQCLHRWQKVLQPGLVKGPWSIDEDNEILLSIQAGIIKWADIAARIPGRIGKQIRERWTNHLDPSLNKGPWTTEEDALLFAAQNKWGNSWTKIAKLIPGRSENGVKNRWNSSRRRRNPAPFGEVAMMAEAKVALQDSLGDTGDDYQTECVPASAAKQLMATANLTRPSAFSHINGPLVPVGLQGQGGVGGVGGSGIGVGVGVGVGGLGVAGSSDLPAHALGLDDSILESDLDLDLDAVPGVGAAVAGVGAGITTGIDATSGLSAESGEAKAAEDSATGESGTETPDSSASPSLSPSPSPNFSDSATSAADLDDVADEAASGPDERDTPASIALTSTASPSAASAASPSAQTRRVGTRSSTGARPTSIHSTSGGGSSGASPSARSRSFSSASSSPSSIGSPSKGKTIPGQALNSGGRIHGTRSASRSLSPTPATVERSSSAGSSRSSSRSGSRSTSRSSSPSGGSRSSSPEPDVDVVLEEGDEKRAVKLTPKAELAAAAKSSKKSKASKREEKETEKGRDKDKDGAPTKKRRMSKKTQPTRVVTEDEIFATPLPVTATHSIGDEGIGALGSVDVIGADVKLPVPYAELNPSSRDLFDDRTLTDRERKLMQRAFLMGMGNAAAVASEVSAFSTPTHASVELPPSSFGSEDSVVDADYLKD